MKYSLIIGTIIILISGIVICNILKLKEGLEGIEEQYLKKQEDYYKGRLSGPNIPGADKFYTFDPSKKSGNQLIMTDSDVKPITNNVDINVKKCKQITNCNELDGTNCGYCFYNNEFYYGDSKGPYTDVCPGGWVKTKEECQERREKAICGKVTNCHEMIGEASICGWCQASNKAMVMQNINGKLEPKYPTQDKCADEGYGLVAQTECTQFGQEHPCIGPNESTGPHSMECLSKLWKEAGCSTKGTTAPSQPGRTNSWWNQRSWESVLADMKAWFSDATGSNWSLVQSHEKGCLGTTPNPCNPKYGGPIECYQTLFTEYGCSNKGSGYPINTKPNISTQEYIEQVKNMVNQSRDSSLTYDVRNGAYNKCHGGNLAAPPPLKVGDSVKYEINVGAGLTDVCADTSENANLVFQGYICKKDGPNCSILWESVTNVNPSSGCDTSPAVWSKNSSNNTTKSVEWITKYLGLCNKAPTYYNGKVQATINESDLILVSSCNASTSCADSNCNMQCILNVSYSPTVEYNVLKTQVTDVLSKIHSKYPGAVICQQNDMQYLVDIGIPHCSCGWFEKDGSLTIGYPSIQGTLGGCGGGSVKVISCVSPNINWSTVKVSVYVRAYVNPSNVSTILKEVGIAAHVVSIVGKSEYNSLLTSQLFESAPVKLSPEKCKWEMTAKGSNYSGNKNYTYTGSCDATFNFKCVADSKTAGTCSQKYDLQNGIITANNGDIVGTTSCCNQSWSWESVPKKVTS